MVDDPALVGMHGLRTGTHYVPRLGEKQTVNRGGGPWWRRRAPFSTALTSLGTQRGEHDSCDDHAARDQRPATGPIRNGGRGLNSWKAVRPGLPTSQQFPPPEGPGRTASGSVAVLPVRRHRPRQPCIHPLNLQSVVIAASPPHHQARRTVPMTGTDETDARLPKSPRRSCSPPRQTGDPRERDGADHLPTGERPRPTTTPTPPIGFGTKPRRSTWPLP